MRRVHTTTDRGPRGCSAAAASVTHRWDAADGSVGGRARAHSAPARPARAAAGASLLVASSSTGRHYARTGRYLPTWLFHGASDDARAASAALDFALPHRRAGRRAARVRTPQPPGAGALGLPRRLAVRATAAQTIERAFTTDQVARGRASAQHVHAPRQPPRGCVARHRPATPRPGRVPPRLARPRERARGAPPKHCTRSPLMSSM